MRGHMTTWKIADIGFARFKKVARGIPASAHVRLGRGWSHEQRKQRVAEVLTVLGLWEVRHTVIGDDLRRV